MKRKIFICCYVPAALAAALMLAAGLWACSRSGGDAPAYLASALPVFVLVLLLALPLSAFLAGRLSGRLSAKVREVSESLKSLNGGEYQPIRTDSRDPEFYAVFREINELSETTHRHIHSEEQERKKLNAVLDNVSQGIIALDPEGSIAFANHSALAIFGGARQDIGKHLVYLIEDTALCKKIQDCAATGGVLEETLEGRELSVAVRRITDAPLSDTVSSIIIVTDVTREKNIAKEKSDFFANASHELKTPITVMLGMSELMLERETLDETAKKQAERIHKEALRMAGLIADMLKLSHLERHTEEPQSVPVDLRAVADEAAAELSPACAAKHVAVEVSGAGTVQADPKKIYELVENLCSNAVNYNKENGSIRITVSEEGGRVVLRVADTGIGIAAEHLPRLCERFYRVDKSRSKKTGGTGLGLAIVKHICAMYGAELQIASKPDVGTTVTVSFPQSA